MGTGKYHFTLEGFLKRCRQEHAYFTHRPWTLQQVGEFWDTVDAYDEINETLYPHYRRFTNSCQLAGKYLTRNDYTMLDIQARSGKASLFWHEKGKIKDSTCCDFSDYLISLSERRLTDSGLQYNTMKILDFPLPFEDGRFNFVCSYETIEHVYAYQSFMRELTRVMSDDGLMIVTCPNVAWEWVHWLSVAININHSEGPHRFLRRKELLRVFKENNLEILEENTTIFLPFNNKVSIKMDQFLERGLHPVLKRWLGLRRTFILKKAKGQ